MITRAAAGQFQFLDPGRLQDAELELIAPEARWIDDVLDACRHPLTLRDAPAEARMTRQQLVRYITNAPLGRQQPEEDSRLPEYGFWMKLNDQPSRASQVRIAGGIGLRVGYTYEVEMYYGHIGYHVYPPARGNRYAERACRLLLPLARRHGMRVLWITCNPDNHASRRTCERLGMTLAEIVPVPKNDPLYLRGEREKCRFYLQL